MGFIKVEDFVYHHLKVNKIIKDLATQNNEEFKFNIFIFYYNSVDSICTEHILQFHKNLKREVNIFSFGIERKEDIINFFKKSDDIYSKNKEYYRDYFYQVILIGMGSHMNTDMDIYETIEEYFSKLLEKPYADYLKIFVLDNKRPVNEIFEENDRWNLVLSESEHKEIMDIFDKYKNNKQVCYKKLSDFYSVPREQYVCLSLMIYPFIQCVSEDDSSSIIFIASISLFSYVKTDQITYEYYNKEIKNMYSDAMNIAGGHFICFEAQRGTLPMLSFFSLNEALEIDERIYIFNHKDMKNTFNQIRTMCHIEIKEFTGNFRQLELKKQNAILIKLREFIKIIKPMHVLGWKRRTYTLFNSDSLYFIINLLYIHINRVKKIETYLYNCLKTSDFLFNIYKDRLKQSEIYDKLIEKHLHKNATGYLSLLIKRVMDSNKKTISITSKFKIYMDIFQTPRYSYTHPFELRLVANMFCSFQAHGFDRNRAYHLIVAHVTDSEDTILFGYTPFNKKDHWPIIFSKVAYSNSEQVTYDTLVDHNTMYIKKTDFRFILDEIKEIFRGIIKHEMRKELNEKGEPLNDLDSDDEDVIDEEEEEVIGKTKNDTNENKNENDKDTEK